MEDSGEGQRQTPKEAEGEEKKARATLFFLVSRDMSLLH